MKKFLSAAAAVGALFGASAAMTPALADEATFSGNVALATDYTFRGVSQTDENPALQGGFDMSYGSFYAGTWASSINFPGYGGANMELDLYAGFKPVLGPVTLDLGAIGYFYPAAADDSPLGELDYWEFYAKPTISPAEGLTLGLGLYYSPEFTGEIGDGFYYEANAAYTISDMFSVSGAVGQQTTDLVYVGGEDSYTTWNVGGTLSAYGFGFDVRYVGTDLDETLVPAAEDRVIFTIKRAL